MFFCFICCIAIVNSVITRQLGTVTFESSDLVQVVRGVQFDSVINLKYTG